VARDAIDLPEVAAFEGERVFDLPPGAAASVVSAAEPVATWWTPSGAFLDLGEAQRVNAIVFELSDAPWVATPRIEASIDGVAWERLEAGASLADATLSLYRDPRSARGEVRFAPRAIRYLRLDPRLPARRGALEIGR
jgi:hypothetical protein